MRAGPLRKRVQWQQRTVTTDSFGQATETWVTAGTFWASLRPLKGNEQAIADQQRGYAQFEIRLRYLGAAINFSPDDRIVYGDRVFNIVNINNTDERNRETLVSATEVN